jgi:hypothetical protein
MLNVRKTDSSQNELKNKLKIYFRKNTQKITKECQLLMLQLISYQFKTHSNIIRHILLIYINTYTKNVLKV